MNAEITSSELVHVKLENLNDSTNETRGALETATPHPDVLADEASYPVDNNHRTRIFKQAAQITVESQQFKTPSPVRPPQCSKVSKPSAPAAKSRQGLLPSSLHSVKTELNSDKNQPSSSKKRPAVKIASFAKASPVDRLAPTGTTGANVLKNTGDSISSAIASAHSCQSVAGGSKHPASQTSLPTPALNAALRSLYNYNAQSVASPSTDASHSEDEEEEDDGDVEEEEILVYMQFDSKLDSDLLQPHTPFKIIGVDSEKPVLQLGNQVFEGNWTDTVGTAVFFEEHPSASPGDPVFMKNPPSTLSYHSKTQKALIMSRIFVKPKAEIEDTDSSSNNTTGPMVPMAIVEVPP